MEIINAFVAQEKPAFEEFSEFLGTRILDGVFRSIAERLKMGLENKDSESVTVPWGTFTAERRVRNGGDSANTNVSYEPSKAFINALNSDGRDRDAGIFQEEFDSDLLDAFADYVAYGFFNPDAPENKDEINKAQKGARLDPSEREYFMNRVANLLVTIAKEKQRDGKTYRLMVVETFGHGWYDFEYNDDKIGVKFTADKAFKQYVKNDEKTGLNI